MSGQGGTFWFGAGTFWVVPSSIMASPAWEADKMWVLQLWTDGTLPALHCNLELFLSDEFVKFRRVRNYLCWKRSTTWNSWDALLFTPVLLPALQSETDAGVMTSCKFCTFSSVLCDYDLHLACVEEAYAQSVWWEWKMLFELITGKTWMNNTLSFQEKIITLPTD